MYQITQSGSGPISLTVKRVSSGAPPLTVSVPGATWGFSPDDDRFAYQAVDNVALYDLSPSTTGGAARQVTSFTQANASNSATSLSFSPHGKYLFDAALTNSSTAALTIRDAVAGAQRFATSYAVLSPAGGVGVPARPKGITRGTENVFGATTWGFSPDSDDQTFAYAYVNGASSASWNAGESPPSNDPY